MDRFCWSDGQLRNEEIFDCRQAGVRIYDGDDKTAFDRGELTLTSHRLLWRDHGDQRCVLEMNLSQVVFVEVEPSGLGRSGKIVAHLNPPLAEKTAGPVTHSQFHFVKFSFKDGGQVEFYRCLQDELARKRWQVLTPTVNQPQAVGRGGVRAAGIVGIERKIQQKNKETDKNISVAFEDLNKLMDKAKDMVSLSKSIANKIRDRQGEITEDETIKFKSYLLSMGIADPVTRETHGSGNKYFRELAKQLSTIMEQSLQESGGIMTLTDAYCRINRARGMELLSPEDLVNACRQLEPLSLPVRFRIFESGVMVLQLLSHSEEALIKQTKEVVSERVSLTAEELSHLVGISVILAKERLLLTEKAGSVCRDDSVEGLRFYANLFLEKAS